MNGAATHLIKKGHEVIIIGFELSDAPVAAKAILVDENNKMLCWLAGGDDGVEKHSGLSGNDHSVDVNVEYCNQEA